MLRHNKNFHEAFHQLNKGEKRKLPEVYFKPVKKVKHQKDMKRKSVYPIEFSPKKLKSLGYYESYEKWNFRMFKLIFRKVMISSKKIKNIRNKSYIKNQLKL